MFLYHESKKSLTFSRDLVSFWILLHYSISSVLTISLPRPRLALEKYGFSKKYVVFLKDTQNSTNMMKFDSLNGFSSHSHVPTSSTPPFFPFPLFFPLPFSLVLQLGKLSVWPSAVQVYIATQDISKLKVERWMTRLIPLGVSWTFVCGTQTDLP